MDVTTKDKKSGMANPPVWPKYQALLDSAQGQRVDMAKLERLERCL